MSGKVMAVVGVAVVMWLGPEDCAQLLWRSAQRVPSLLRGSAGLRPGLWRKEQVGVGEQVGGLRAEVGGDWRRGMAGRFGKGKGMGTRTSCCSLGRGRGEGRGRAGEFGLDCCSSVFSL